MSVYPQVSVRYEDLENLPEILGAISREEISALQARDIQCRAPLGTGVSLSSPLLMCRLWRVAN